MFISTLCQAVIFFFLPPWIRCTLQTLFLAGIITSRFLPAAGSFCGSWRGLCAGSLRTWYPLRRLPVADEKGVKTENNDRINLKVVGQDGSVVQFKIKRHTPLSKLMKAYCERQGLSMRQMRFRFVGQPINEIDTSAQLEKEDEDTVDIFQQQTGGVF